MSRLNFKMDKINEIENRVSITKREDRLFSQDREIGLDMSSNRNIPYK